ncbi:MAG TPA: Bax inhibitor-1/YccA family protein [Tessaracoccus flavescens]|uniref:Bax inhibitor-1/YccA family protein n=1 Tax=Tessaracoccus flavescens TaxID=399497 RepID=A0A921EP54_9ACTN|nr:Bax inhibitor-1/YccA family protein [Tessaracoccus flavescens]
MANPIMSRPDAFTRHHGPQQRQAFPQQGYGQPQDPYGQYQQPQGYSPYEAPARPGGVMTLDDVLAKTAITLGAVAVAAVAAFMLIPMSLITPAVIVSAIVGLVTVMVVAGRRVLPVGGVLFYAVVEGIFVGAFSKMFEMFYPGIVVSAVLATFVAAGATLAAYKFFNIRVTAKFRKVVFIATAAFAGVMLVNFVLALFGVNTGLRDIGSGAGMLAIGVSLLAVILAVLNLITDFDAVERGIAQQAPASESWRAALGITVTMVWLYVEILRILSYFRGD